ncbi:hypothetical protein [Burkholderia sp. 4M9327F10]|uniref:hypothetical protein n=1 Tax=Burkholderia sp. 4M9327F10 TaxID=2502223 RepID=UPI0010F63ABB|nr:hypothetical protein [Burkholderia sp. 4M9327F10]
MTEAEADRLTKEALRTAHARAGDSESATESELFRMMRNDVRLQEAFVVVGIARLRGSQKIFH